ncbi:MAG: isoprenylcysteine carboxylmethyltransferase family protein [Elusimicrobia bacterium]|nr:isoprenylcysteine carboxylmethyltransferase family protein [Elusimicrobiota bacterium]
MRPFLLAYVLIGVILLGELIARGGKRPESRRRDRGSLWVIALLTGSGYWLAFLFAAYAAAHPTWRAAHPGYFLGAWASWAAVALTVGGMGFRLWAVRLLGRYFTRDVRVSADQPVVEAGPYRLIRHPSYTGALAAGAGVGLALGAWPCPLLILAGKVPSFLYRIRVEEAALVEAIGEPYRAYRARTKRLIPHVW